MLLALLLAVPCQDAATAQKPELYVPPRGFYHRRDGRLGSYTIWYERLQPTRGCVVALCSSGSGNGAARWSTAS
ncbi:MAG: hypothetical protein GY711_19500 [bacterium]|nr:hypothetical protein [bacterium]